MKKIAMFILAFVSCLNMMAQEEGSTKKFDIKKLEIGGRFGFSFGSSDHHGSSTAIQVMPQVGYRFSNMFSAGAGIGYIYRDWDDYSENYAGMSLYARFRPIRYISLLAEPQLFYTWGSYYDSRAVPCLLLGVGTSIPVGNNLGISFSLSYDVVDNDYSPYRGDLVYSIGFSYGF